MSKGSRRRPCQIPQEELDRRWQEAFGITQKEGVAYGLDVIKDLPRFFGIPPTSSDVIDSLLGPPESQPEWKEKTGWPFDEPIATLKDGEYDPYGIVPVVNACIAAGLHNIPTTLNIGDSPQPKPPVGKIQT
jgi:hypothetical protein